MPNSKYENLKASDPELYALLDDLERVLGNTVLEFEIEGEERDVWHQLQVYMGMSTPDDEG